MRWGKQRVQHSLSIGDETRPRQARGMTSKKKVIGAAPPDPRFYGLTEIDAASFDAAHARTTAAAAERFHVGFRHPRSSISPRGVLSELRSGVLRYPRRTRCCSCAPVATSRCWISIDPRL